MWHQPWTYKEGIAVAAGLIVVGLLLQFCVGSINWDLVEWPVNIIMLCCYVATLATAFSLRKKSYVIRWCMSYNAAVPALLISGIATVGYGITCIRETLSFWPFVLLYVWLTTIAGLSCIKLIAERRSLGAILCHAGFFLAVTCATLGSADMQKLRMQISSDSPEWRALDDAGNIHELDIALELNHFTIDEYPPKLVVIDNATGKALPQGKSESIVLEDSVTEGQLLDYQIKVSHVYDYAAQVSSPDSVNYVAWAYNGATSAALVEVSKNGKSPIAVGWVSNGSYMFPYKALRLSANHSLVMPERDPKRYVSNVNVYTKSGIKKEGVEIEVNKPLKIEGWNIYQLSYDERMGRWSSTSVVELVNDPWLPAVYVGIYMLLAGAVVMFFTINHKRKQQ
ncbi:MAG: cytochrome c biogenesis protein ResB [Bacteroidales bacterium]|nr:cytochrome c biogenesis protein ResB [Bacteroidales bacterium]